MQRGTGRGRDRRAPEIIQLGQPRPVVLLGVELHDRVHLQRLHRRGRSVRHRAPMDGERRGAGGRRADRPRTRARRQAESRQGLGHRERSRRGGGQRRLVAVLQGTRSVLDAAPLHRHRHRHQHGVVQRDVGSAPRAVRLLPRSSSPSWAASPSHSRCTASRCR